MMKKAVSLMILMLLMFGCVACAPSDANGEKYSLDISYGLGGDTTQTLLTFDATIGGTKNDIENIDAYEVLINTEYLDLLLENGPYSSIVEKDYMQITGSILFDTIGMTKEEIDAMSLLQGFKLIEKNGNEFDLYLSIDS